MPSANFIAALNYVLLNEGGSAYTNDPLDPGGPTRYGCTLATLSAWRISKGKPAATAKDVQNLTLAEAQDIYEALYWRKVGGDAIADTAIATVLLDSATLTGTGWTASLAQAIASSLTGTPLVADGIIGPKSIAAINACNRRAMLEAWVARQNARFMDIVTSKPTSLKYLGNWSKRASRYLQLNWASPL